VALILCGWGLVVVVVVVVAGMGIDASVVVYD
jgi:hypothetical protein